MRAPLRTLTVAFSAFLALGPMSSGAGGAPYESAAGDVAGKTVIQWTGSKGMVLQTAQGSLAMTADDTVARPGITLDTDGSFAFALLQPRNQPAHGTGCATVAVPMCERTWLVRVNRLGRTTFAFSEKRGGGLDTAHGPLDVYLVSDGEARLTIEPEGLTGAREYRAGGRIDATLRTLGAFCPTLGCDDAAGGGYASRYAFGGASEGLGSLGLAGVFAYQFADDPTGVTGNSPQTRVCQYPNDNSPDASADPRDHPYGCDLPGDDSYAPDQATDPVDQIVSGAGIADRSLHPDVYHGQRGPRYVGYHAGSIGAWSGEIGAYGLWLRYGIAGADRDPPDPGPTSPTLTAPESDDGSDGGAGPGDAARRPEPPADCRDDAAPQTAIRTARTQRGRLLVVGTAADRGCAGRVARVEVAVVRRVGRRCRFIRVNGSLTSPRACSAAIFVRASGTARWKVESRRPAQGRYRVLARAIDAAGNVEPRPAARWLTAR